MFHNFKRIISSKKLRKKVRLDNLCKKIKESNDEIIKNIISGIDKRYIIVCGPCGADDSDAVLEFALKLKELSIKIKDKIFLMPRLYTAKARSVGDGYLGMMFNPDDEKVDISKGVEKTRHMLANCIAQTGLPIADEFLYLEQLEYNADLISYYFIGARQSDSPLFRNLASGLDVAVGIKNNLSGNLQNLAGGIHAISTRKDFYFNGGQGTTLGNKYVHGVLRGYSDNNGTFYNNVDQNSIDSLKAYCKTLNSPSEFVMIDCSHANSGKRAVNQRENAIKAITSTNARGLMLESYLFGGQSQNTYGVSKVDDCLGWEDTKQLILDIYDLLPEIN